ncbi:MAG: DUF502 domain-containing protein [Acidobacteria bacterium]|nr:DUF502 domain-containing protein [Acidobacteriota bacterium]
MRVGLLPWLRRSFIAGFFVTVPLIISILALVWAFRVIDGFMGPVYARWLGREVPGLGLATTAAVVLLVGAIAGNVLGRRLVRRAEEYLLRVPVFRTIYSPVKQLLEAFSPDTEGGLKRVVIVRDSSGALLLGFLTKEFELDLGQGPAAVIAVYVPTNNLYLGDVRVFSRDAAFFPEISVEEGVRIILTGGMAMADRIRAIRGGQPLAGVNN